MALAAGFADPVRDTAAVFRAVLDAMARPGRLHHLPVLPAVPAGLSPAAAAVALTLVDHDAPLWLAPQLASDAIETFLRFHTGAALAASPDAAAFALGRWGSLPVARLPIGEPEFPERGTTLIIIVDGLATGRGHRLTGPGIDGDARLAIDGVDEGFAAMLSENAALHPLGRDVILCAGDRLAAIPRTTRVEG